jgi:hypothetical protein
MAQTPQGARYDPRAEESLYGDYHCAQQRKESLIWDMPLLPPDFSEPPSLAAPPPPPESWWKRHIARRATAIREWGLGGLSFGCVVAAFGLGGDMELTGVVLSVGWILGGVAILTAPKWSAFLKAVTILALTLFFGFDGVFLNRHFHAQEIPSVGAGATIAFAVLPPRLLANGVYKFPLRVYNSGNEAVLNYYFQFGEVVAARLLTAQEEDESFKELVSEPFNATAAIARSEMLKSQQIINSIPVGGFYEVMQSNAGLNADQTQQINSGKIFAYHFLALEYTDKASFASGLFYYAEYCGRYEPSMQGVSPCTGHNFIKQPIR